MILSDFIKKYREGVKQATGKGLSGIALSKLVGVDKYRLQKWEQGIAQPKDDNDRISVKLFFGLEDFLNIGEDVLKSAIDRYPEGLHEEVAADNKTNSSKQKNKEKLSNDKDNLLSSQLTINDEDMHTLNLEMVRHIMEMSKQIVETNSILARKIPDLKDGEVERKPLKERRA